MSQRAPVVVIGAGLAGLAAAWRLTRAGLAPVVLEASDAVGGRATSHAWDGVETDAISHRITAADRHLIGLVTATGLADDLLPPRYFLRAQVTPRDVRTIEPRERWDVMRIPGVRLHEGFRLARLPRLVRRFGAGLDADHPERAVRLDDRSLGDFARLYFGPSVLAHWMEPALAEGAPADPEETSRVAFLLRYVREHWLDGGTLRAPVARLVRALADAGNVRTGHAVESVVPEGDGWRVRARTAGGAVEIAAHAVVLAVPAPDARVVAGGALTFAEREALASVRYTSALVGLAALRPDAVPVATRVRVPGASGSALASLALEPAAFEGVAPGGLARATLVARDAWSRARLAAADEAVAKELVAELAALLPELARAVESVRVVRFPRAQPSFAVGRYRALARMRRIEADRWRAGRHLAHAGDHWIAPSLEGAVVSGLRAAERVLGRPSGADVQSPSSTSVTPSPPASAGPGAKRVT